MSIASAPSSQTQTGSEYELSIPGDVTDMAVSSDSRLFITGVANIATFPITSDAYDAICERCPVGSALHTETWRFLAQTPRASQKDHYSIDST